MTAVAIHQPNYAPWLGYFHKMKMADLFVFLDDVQFSKGSYTNRVQVLGSAGARWLTQPVSVSLGTAICDVQLSNSDWTRAHLRALEGAYRKSRAFMEVWPDVEEMYGSLSQASLAAVNEALIACLADKLAIEVRTVRSSQIDTGSLMGDDRLIAIAGHLAPSGTYVSGKGGASYQDPKKFAAAGLTIEYTNFDHPDYDQGRRKFVPGLSVLDAIFHMGWGATADLLASC